jgi:hypothetical protein
VDREEDALASRHDGCWLGLFVEHLVGAQKLKGLKTPFKSTQPPAKTTPNKQKTNGSQSKNGFVPKINKKNEKEWKNFEKWVFGKNGEKWKKWANGRPAVGGMAGERPAVGRGMVGL